MSDIASRDKDVPQLAQLINHNAPGTFQHATTNNGDREFTAFHFRILAILYDDPQYGLAIKRDLEDYYGKDVNHGRLYPNLDTLIETGYLKKGKLDDRTNQYELTDKGRQVVHDQAVCLLDDLGVPLAEIQRLLDDVTENRGDEA